MKALAALTEPPPKTAWEHYALGRWCLQQDRLDQAAGLLDRAVELQPHNLWPNFYRGVCAYRRHQYQDALVCFQVCVALASGKAECYYNRGLAQVALKRPEEASKSYTKALA